MHCEHCWKQTRLRAWLRKFGGVSNLRNYISFFELLFNSKEISIHHSVLDGLGGWATWKEKYKPIRGMIDDIFKLAKNAFSLKILYRYTKRSVKKFVCLRVLLVGIVVSWVLTQRRNYRRLLNSSLWRGLRVLYTGYLRRIISRRSSYFHELHLPGLQHPWGYTEGACLTRISLALLAVSTQRLCCARRKEERKR